MSGASRSRSARARAEKADRQRSYERQRASQEVSLIDLQIQLASGGGPRGRVRTEGSNRRGGGGERRYIWIRVLDSRNRSVPTRIYAPSASAIPALQKARARASLRSKITHANITIESLGVVPYFPTPKRGLRLSSRQARKTFSQERQANKAYQSSLHGAKMNLYNAQLELSAFDKGVTVKNLKNKPVPPIAPFLIQGRGQKLATLSKQSGFDVGKQLQMTNDRFGLDLTVDDVTSNFVTGGLLGEASTIFTRNRKINKLKETLIPAQPDIVSLDDNSDFDLLYERRESIVNQQQLKLGELNKIKDEDLRLARIETDLPMFNLRAGEIDGLIGGLETRITDIKKTRKPQDLLSSTGSLTRFGLKDLVNRRNKLTKIRNEKVDLFNTIKDPALRHVTKTQDIPQFDDRIFKLDQDIDRGVKFGQSRKQLNIGILNAPVKRKGRAPKTFDVTIGDDTQTFKRTERGAKRATLFFETAKSKKNKELDAISDPIERQIAKDQDFGILDLGISASKTQRKVLKSEKRQELELLNIGGGASAQTGFLPFTPANTPTGKLSIQPLRKSRNIPKVFDQLDFGRKRGANRNQFDLGRMFGQNRGRTKINKRQRGTIDFF